MKKDSKGRILSHAEEEISNIIKNKYPRLEYAGGYTGIDDYLCLKCKECGNVFKHNSQIMRPSRNTVIVCKECVRIRKEKLKLSKVLIKILNKRKKELIKLQELTSECIECGVVFIGTSRGKKFCSNTCLTRHHSRKKEIKKRLRLKENGRNDYSITLNKLIERDKGLCQICGTKVNVNEHSNNNDYPSIDHIFPVVKGGTHTWDNVQLAHRGCNLIKRDSLASL